MIAFQISDAANGLLDTENPDSKISSTLVGAGVRDLDLNHRLYICSSLLTFISFEKFEL